MENLNREKPLTVFSYYNGAIQEACGVDADEAHVIENVLRVEPAYRTLDHLTKRQLASAAREAQETLAILRVEDPEIARAYETGAI